MPQKTHFTWMAPPLPPLDALSESEILHNDHSKCSERRKPVKMLTDCLLHYQRETATWLSTPSNGRWLLTSRLLPVLAFTSQLAMRLPFYNWKKRHFLCTRFIVNKTIFCPLKAWIAVGIKRLTSFGNRLLTRFFYNKSYSLECYAFKWNILKNKIAI